MLDAIATEDDKLRLARAHPQLAGSETLTPHSSAEQARLGFSALSKTELAEMAELNRSYQDKFGFPCIVALRLHAKRESVLAEMKRRDAARGVATLCIGGGEATALAVERIN